MLLSGHMVTAVTVTTCCSGGKMIIFYKWPHENHLFSIHEEVIGNTRNMTILQGIDNEFVTNLCKILWLKRCLQTGKNMPDEGKSPVRKQGVCLRETTSFLPRNWNSARICQIFSQNRAVFRLFFAILSDYIYKNVDYFYLQR